MNDLLPQATRILVIRYRFIGDTILTVPFLRNLRRAYPQAKIDVLVGPQSGEVLTGCPYVNELIPFDTTRFHKYDSGPGKKKNFWAYVFQLRKNRYDMVFVLKRSWSSALLALFTGARHRIGYASHGRKFLLTQAVPFRTDMHEVDSTLTVLKAAGIPIVDKYLEAWITNREKEEVATFIPSATINKKKVLIHAAAAHPDKIYPLSSWVKIVARLNQEYGFIPFFTGAEQDFALYEELQKLSGVVGVNLAGKLTLRQSMAIYSTLNLAICVDSGPAHLAAAAGIPVLSIFGPTDPVRWAPYSALLTAGNESFNVGGGHAQPKGDACIAPTAAAILDMRIQSVTSTQNTCSNLKNISLTTNATIYEDTLACRPCNYHKTCIDRPCLTELDPEKIINRALELCYLP